MIKSLYFNAFIGVLLIFMLTQPVLTKKATAAFPKEVIKYMASRKMRYHHFLWHQIRSLWHVLDEKTQNLITKYGWQPPHPALSYGEMGEPIVEELNYSGEDFFLMHHEMIAQVKKILKDKKIKDVQLGFKNIPAPGDSDYPALPTYTIAGAEFDGLNSIIQYLKQDDFYWQQIKPYEELYKDPDYLRSVTLGQYGAQMEYTIHNWMHMRFSQKPIGMRPDNGEALQNIDHEWDKPEYDTLLDTYSAHVNPTFWMIHGWIDDRIEDWRKANGLDKIEWKGTWTGGDMSKVPNLIKKTGKQNDDLSKDEDEFQEEDYESRLLEMTHHEMEEVNDMEGMEEDQEMKNMEELVKILLATGKCFRYDQKIQLKSIERLEKLARKMKCKNKMKRNS